MVGDGCKLKMLRNDRERSEIEEELTITRKLSWQAITSGLRQSLLRMTLFEGSVHFSVEIEPENHQSNKQRRCWIFAGLNTMRFSSRNI